MHVDIVTEIYLKTTLSQRYENMNNTCQKTLDFIAPGSGTWELDSAHFSRPMTLFSRELFTDSLVRGLKDSTSRYGLMLSHLEYAYVNGFFYKKTIFYGIDETLTGALPIDTAQLPHIVKRIKIGEDAITNRLWLQDLKIWDNEIKPDSIRRNASLQFILPEQLTNKELLQHLIECRNNALEMMYRHHLFTIPAVLPIGLYLHNVSLWTGLASSELLYLLSGSSQISKGIAEEILANLVKHIKEDKIAPHHFSNMNASEAISELKKQGSKATNDSLRLYLDAVSYRLITGYDITDKYGLDMLEVIVNNIWLHYSKDQNIKNDIEFRETQIRNMVPSELRANFDLLLEDARIMNRLRDERGIYNDVLATGLARRAILEIGERLAKQKKISDKNLLLYASFEEIKSFMENKSYPSNDELSSRKLWHNDNSINNAPPRLGSCSSLEFSLEIFPASVHTNMGALFTAMKEIYNDIATPSIQNKTIAGMSVNNGIYVGTARVINNIKDFDVLKKGDVLITKNTTAAFNVILPILGAIVTDRGGQLSHAAIVSREFGIPGVVGTKNATQFIHDGALVRVDGNLGIVEVLQ